MLFYLETLCLKMNPGCCSIASPANNIKLCAQATSNVTFIRKGISRGKQIDSTKLDMLSSGCFLDGLAFGAVLSTKMSVT